MPFRFSKPLHLSFLVLLGAFAAMSALANDDGTLDTSLAPALGADPFHGTPGLFDYLINLGGTGSAMNSDYVAATAVQVDAKILRPDGRGTRFGANGCEGPAGFVHISTTCCIIVRALA